MKRLLFALLFFCAPAFAQLQLHLCTDPAQCPVGTIVVHIASGTASQPAGGVTVSVAPASSTSLANPMANVAVGLNPDFGSYKPLAATDANALDMSAAPVSFMNAAFHARYDGLHIGPDSSIPINVVDSSTQAGRWRQVRPQVSGDDFMVFDPGNLTCEGGGECFPNSTNYQGDRHALVYNKDPLRLSLTEIYQGITASGDTILPYSAGSITC